MKHLLLIGLPLWGTALGTLGLLVLPSLPGGSQQTRDPAPAVAAPPATDQAGAAGGWRWQEIVAPPLPRPARDRVLDTARSCLAGPLPGRSEIVRATQYPRNHCACLAAGMLRMFSPDESARLDGALNHGRRAPGRLEQRWLTLRARCIDVPRHRRLQPYPSPITDP